MSESPQVRFDLIVSGGRVLDPASGIDQVADVAVRNGRIVAIEPDLLQHAVPRRQEYPPDLGTQVVDARGKVVTSGLIDLHAHVFTGICPLTVPADEIAMQTGVTTIVSAGDAGAHMIEGMRRLVVDASRTRVVVFLNISTIGLAGWPVGEAADLDYLDVPAAVDAVERNRDIVRGIKVRQSAPLIVGSHGIEPLRRARRVAENVGLPVMVHIGDAPVPLSEILAELVPGDIVTHCFTGSNNGILVGDGLAPEVQAARKRGVIFDVGHGFGSFSYPVAETCFRAGFHPDCISTDIHSLSASGQAVDMPTTMSKFLELGMDLDSVIMATTSRPAAVLGLEDVVGSLLPGRVADIAVLEVKEEETTFQDSVGNSRRASRRIVARHTIRAGIPWLGPFPHPGRALSALS
ncbi:MAG: amidohydrolase/deacetylase family metallohydrolase [Acidimicrobiales bacterium]